jgi:CO dehydrogenase maturation factor
MGYTIAIAGKGGTGKTTVAGLLVRILTEKRVGSILAIDADPNNNLAEALGVKTETTISQIIDDIAKHPEKIPSGISKDRFIAYQIETIIQENDGFDLLTMGRPEGPGCYCYANSVLRNITDKLIKGYDYIVIDNEAGFEHLARKTTRIADTLVVVSDATRVGLRSAQRINELAKELDLKIKKRLLIINRYEDVDKQSIKDLGLEYIGNIPLDNGIAKISLDGNSLMKLEKEAMSLKMLRKMEDKIW